MKRWLYLVIPIVALALLAATAGFWLPPLLTFAGANSDVIQGLTSLVQLVLWLGAGAAFLVGLWRGGKSADAAPTVAAEHKKIEASGERSVAPGGDVMDSIIVTGKVRDIYNVYLTPSGRPALGQPEFERSLGDYLSWVGKAYGTARLYGLESIRISGEYPKRHLSDVFVPLTLRRFQPPHPQEIEQLVQDQQDHFERIRAYLKLVEQKQGEGQIVPLDSLLTTSKRLAVIGGPGSGKSTLLAYLAASLAAAAQTGAPLHFALPPKVSTCVPLIIPLRNFRQYQLDCQKSSEERLRDPRAGTLAGFVPWYLKHRSGNLQLSEDFFDRLLRGGGCLLMLDGLDEVVSRQERGRVRQQVEDLANDIYPNNHFVVTAREAGYQQDAVFGDDFTRLDVQRLDESQIKTLVENWCRQLYPGEYAQRTDELVKAIEKINALRAEKDLPPLVSSPLMTTMVVSVKWGKAELPSERAKLYEAAVEVILQAQYIPEVEGRKELVEWGGPWDDQRGWLAHLALEMHRGGRAGAAVPEERVREFLRGKLADQSLEQFIEAVRARGGLFEERAELFQFVHLTFQEFLAARSLTKDREQVLPGLIRHVTDPWWREVLLLIYGFARTDHPPFAREYLDWLSSQKHDTTTHLAGLELAGAAVLEIERPDPARRKQQAERPGRGFGRPEHSSPGRSPRRRW